MYEKEIELAGFSLKYMIRDDKVTITGCNALASEVVVPDRIEDTPVCSIDKKAFLSKKQLRRVTLPATVETIGDWAFAYCSKLTSVSLQNENTVWGRFVFLECNKLQELKLVEHKDNVGSADRGEFKTISDQVGSAQAVCEQVDFQPELLAAAITKMDAPYLLELSAVGTANWLEKWDARLVTLINTPDNTGYSNQVLCGEEDYGSTDMEAYLSNSRKKKVRLILIRLLHQAGLSESLKQDLLEYCLTHTKGCASEEAWQVILKECGDNADMYKLFAEIGCVTSANIDGILSDIGESYPEMKAYFVDFCSGSGSGDDFFAGLEL